jgi:CubicO group peptidase (beta-lactamase class C family)
MRIVISYLFLLWFVSNLTNSANAQAIATIDGEQISAEQLERFVNEQMAARKIPGLSLAIINNGNIAFAKNFGVKNAVTLEPVDERTIFEACSISKPVFAYFVLKQIEKGILDLDKPLCEYYLDPDLDASDERHRQLTARMVLCHASGFPNWRADGADKLAFQSIPGIKYGYSGEGYQLLSRVLAHILKKTDVELNDVFQEDIVKPLGIQSMNFTWNASLEPLKAFSHREGKPTDNTSQGPENWFGSAGSLHTNANDYARFLINVLDEKNNVGAQLLALQTNMPTEPDGLHRSMGFPQKIVQGKVRYFHLGNNSDARAYCHFYQNEGMGVVMFGNCDNFFSSGFGQSLLLYLHEEVPY